MRRHAFLAAVVIGGLSLAASASAACDPSKLDACVAWAQKQVEALGCRTDAATFRNVVEDLSLGKGCALRGTAWTDRDGKPVKGGFENGVNTDSGGCIARYTPSAYLKSGGYFRTPTEALNGSLRNKGISGCEYDSDLGKKDAAALTPPIVAGLRNCSCAGAEKAAAPATTEANQPSPNGDCPGDHRKKMADFCVCDVGYEVDAEQGGCRFITDGAGLTDGSEKIGDATQKALETPDVPQVVEVTAKGKTSKVAVVSDPGDVGTFLYTVDGVHFYRSLADALRPPLGKTLLDDARGALAAMSPFNWFSSNYKGDDKDLKFKIGRSLVYDDIDDHRSWLVRSLRYMNDFQGGLAAYIDLRASGKSPDAILTNDQDIDADVERLTSRLRIAAFGKKDGLSDDDKARLDAAQKKELYAAYEDGYRRYLAAKALEK